MGRDNLRPYWTVKQKYRLTFTSFVPAKIFQTYFIVCDKRQRAAIAEHLDKFIFADKVEILDRSGDFVANSLISGSTIAVDLLKQAGSSAQYFAPERQALFPPACQSLRQFRCL